MTSMTGLPVYNFQTIDSVPYFRFIMNEYAYYARFSYSLIISNILYPRQASQNMSTLQILNKTFVSPISDLVLA